MFRQIKILITSNCLETLQTLMKKKLEACYKHDPKLIFLKQNFAEKKLKAFENIYPVLKKNLERLAQ